ncbi:MAG: glycosyltransferase family 2 protein [Candidatus Omnitrophota bacterium]|nr:glycosyltransferase family 2 protein [Candidatus Omnitrophota bacterium]
MPDNKVKFSVVIPVYNEEKSILPLHDSLCNIMDKMRENYEIIFVNDGSQDKTRHILNGLFVKSLHLLVVNFNKNRGQSLAMQAGFDVAKGEFIITIDGDLQNDPSDIPLMFHKINQGYDVVCGWRYKRHDPRIRVFLAMLSSVIRKIVFREVIHDPGCTLRIFKKDAVKDIFLFTGTHRLFALIMSRLGYKLGEVKVIHHKRKFGNSKYSIYTKIIDGVAIFIKFCLFDMQKLMHREKRKEGWIV